MIEVTLRNSGNATILVLPRLVLEAAGLGVGSVLSLEVVDKAIVLKPKTELTLEDLLAGSPREKLRLPDDDAWPGSR